MLGLLSALFLAESCRPKEEGKYLEWRRLFDEAGTADEGMRGGRPGVKADRAGMAGISTSIHRMLQLGGCHDRVPSPKADAALEEEAKAVEELVPTPRGRAEAARLRSLIEDR
jgi:hypothetical protein